MFHQIASCSHLPLSISKLNSFGDASTYFFLPAPIPLLYVNHLEL